MNIDAKSIEKLSAGKDDIIVLTMPALEDEYAMHLRNKNVTETLEHLDTFTEACIVAVTEGYSFSKMPKEDLRRLLNDD